MTVDVRSAFAETLRRALRACGSAATAIAKRDFEQHFSVDLLVKDQTLMLEEAASLKVPMPGLAALREVFQAARAQGWGQEDIAAVYKVIEMNAGV